MRRRDLDKLRALDPKIAAQLEDVLRRREGESPDAEPPSSERDASTTVPEVVEASEVCECPPLLPSNDVDDETLLFCGCSPAEVEAEDLDEKERAPTRPESTSKAKAVGDVDALVASVQRDLDDEEANKPACKRSLESQVLPHWHETSTRREDAHFEHPSQFAFLRKCDDADLGKRWGWASKHRGRGLSDLDQAVQREVYARCYGFHDVYGLRWEPRVSSWLVESLRAHGIRSRIAHVVMALLEQMITRGRWALRLSASDVRTLYGWSASGWWYAIWVLEEKGLLTRVGSIKDQEEYGAPVQRDTNLYVLGPWWAASSRGRPSPVETALAFASSTSDDGQRVQADLLALRRRRRRALNTASRDRNRARYRDLPPKAFTSRALVHTLERLSKLRTDADARCERAEATAMFRGRIPFRFGETKPSREVGALLGVDTSALERAAQAETARVNAGLRSDPGDLYRAGGALGRTFESVQFLLPCEDLTAIPKGKIEGKISSTGDPDSSPKTGPPRRAPTQNPRASETSPSSDGDKSSSQRPLRDRARALEGEGGELRAQSQDPPLRGQAFFEHCHQSIFGKPD